MSKKTEQRIAPSRRMLRRVGNSFATGFGSCLSLNGDFYQTPIPAAPKMPVPISEAEAFRLDAQALRSDWQQVGSDLQKSMHRLKSGGVL